MWGANHLSSPPEDTGERGAAEATGRVATVAVPVEGGEDERVVHLHILVAGGVGREIEREIVHLVLAGEDRRI